MEDETYYIVIKLTCKPNSDIQEIMAECDYSVTHENIWDTELIGEQNE